MHRLILIIFLTGALSAKAQTTKETAIKAINTVLTKYRSSPYLGFDLNYYCSSEKLPSVYIDSLQGKVKLHNGSCWYLLDSTEAIVTDSFALTIFKEDRIIYVAKPPLSLQLVNIAGLSDSLMAGAGDVNYEITRQGKKQLVTLSFLSSPVFKRIEYHIDSTTGLLSRIRMLIEASQLYDASVKDRLAEEKAYAVVDIFYSDYRYEPFDVAIFNKYNYLKIEDNEIKPADHYNSFRIFSGVVNN